MTRIRGDDLGIVSTMRTLVSSVLLVTAACSSSASGSHTNTDAPAHGSIDAPGSGSNNPLIDAPIAGIEGIGKACAPGTGTGITQGDCPTGYLCLSLTGGTHPWCSKTCTAGTGDTCNTGYTGPGLAQCYLQVTPSGGGTAMNFCGAICEDDTTNPANQICPTSKCNGTCPSTPALACTAALTNNGTMVAKGCQ